MNYFKKPLFIAFCLTILINCSGIENKHLNKAAIQHDTINQQLQLAAYTEIKQLLISENAESVYLVIVNAITGELLTSSYVTPTSNDSIDWSFSSLPLTQSFEPGYLVAPLVLAKAMEDGFIDINTTIDNTERFQAGKGFYFRDKQVSKQTTIAEILKQKSIVGVAQISSKMPNKYLFNTFKEMGFGESPIESINNSQGELVDYQAWNSHKKMLMTIGKANLSTSALQLAKAYTIFADNGNLHSISLSAREHDNTSKQLISAETANAFKTMLQLKKTEVSDTFSMFGMTDSSLSSYPNKHLISFAGGYSTGNQSLVFALIIDKVPVTDNNKQETIKRIKISLPSLIKRLSLYINS